AVLSSTRPTWRAWPLSYASLVSSVHRDWPAVVNRNWTTQPPAWAWLSTRASRMSPPTTFALSSRYLVHPTVPLSHATTCWSGSATASGGRWASWAQPIVGTLYWMSAG